LLSLRGTIDIYVYVSRPLGVSVHCITRSGKSNLLCHYPGTRQRKSQFSWLPKQVKMGKTNAENRRFERPRGRAGDSSMWSCHPLAPYPFRLFLAGATSHVITAIVVM